MIAVTTVTSSKTTGTDCKMHSVTEINDIVQVKHTSDNFVAISDRTVCKKTDKHDIRNKCNMCLLNN